MKILNPVPVKPEPDSIIENPVPQNRNRIPFLNIRLTGAGTGTIFSKSGSGSGFFQPCSGHTLQQWTMMDNWL